MSAAGLTITSDTIPAGQRLRGDGDSDNPADLDGNGDIDTNNGGGTDHDNDLPTPASYRLPDADDRTTFAYGHAPTAARAAVIASVVRRFYAAARADNGSAACPLLLLSMAKSLPEDYGRGAGPSYLRGGKTCAAVMTLLFAHLRSQLSESITVLSVRALGSDAQVVFSSREMRASFIYLQLEHGAWKVGEIVGQPLP